MTCHINQVLKQALVTFGGLQAVVPKNLEKLKILLDKTTAADVGLQGHEVLKPETWKAPNKAPVSYIDLYEDNTVSMGIFILGEGSKLPLHDHPCMHGLIKVVSGTLRVTSYSIHKDFNGKEVEVESHSAVDVDFKGTSTVLTPNNCNLHEIESVNGIAAFLDVLAPPYNDYGTDNENARTCSYYKPIREVAGNKLLLQRIQCPAWYYCDNFPYEGPLISEQLLLENQESENVS